MKSKYVKRTECGGNSFGVSFSLSYAEIADAINNAYEDLGRVTPLCLSGDGRLSSDMCRDYCRDLGSMLSCMDFSSPDNESSQRTDRSIRQLNQEYASHALGLLKPRKVEYAPDGWPNFDDEDHGV